MILPMTHRSRLLRGAAAAVLGAALAVSAAGCSSSTETTSQSATAESLDVTAFAERVATDGVVVLDVRTPAEFAEGHLPGAVNIDVESGDFTSDIAELDKDAEYAIYCRSGNRSKVAMQTMADEGFTDLADLNGGIGDWAANGGPVVTD